MTTQDTEQDWRDTPFSERQQTSNHIAPAVILIVIAVWIGTVLFPNDRGYAVNVYTDALSILITLFVINVLNERRAQQQLRLQLIREMGSPFNVIAARAVEELKVHGWGFGRDLSLRGAILHAANLEGVDLFNSGFIFGKLGDSELHYTDPRLQMGINLEKARLGLAILAGAKLIMANLQEAAMYSTNLKQAQLHHANLQRAHLGDADLQEANLFEANLRGAILGRANLQRAWLTGTDLRGANLEGALMQGAYWENTNPAKFDSKTILPNGSPWTPDTDMSHFTSTNNP